FRSGSSQPSLRYARVREGTGQQIKVDKRTLPSAPCQNLWVPENRLSKAIKTSVERTRTVGYGELLRTNRRFRVLWLGQVVSQMGDWFDTIAGYTIVLHLTGSGSGGALMMVARFLPSVLTGPLSGVVAAG